MSLVERLNALLGEAAPKKPAAPAKPRAAKAKAKAAVPTPPAAPAADPEFPGRVKTLRPSIPRGKRVRTGFSSEYSPQVRIPRWHADDIPGFWVGPDGKTIELQDSDIHSEYVVDNPDIFFPDAGYGGEDTLFYMDADAARVSALKLGWIAVRPWRPTGMPGARGTWVVVCGYFRPSRRNMEALADKIVERFPEAAKWPVTINPVLDDRYGRIEGMTWEKIQAGYLWTVEPDGGMRLFGGESLARRVRTLMNL